MRFEICVDSMEGVRAAHAAGADRVELCAALVEGGTTPTLGAIRLARTVPDLRLHVMIRPRGGDFLYDDDEIAQMASDIAVAKEEGADGIVLGLLLPDGTIDAEKTAHLITAARPMQVTFHRAFDLAADPVAALATLIELGVERVLTSGQEETALKGLPLICDLIRRADGHIIVMPGGGINSGNARLIARQSGCREMHFAALQPSESAMKFRRFNIPMGAPLGGKLGEYARTTTNRTAIRAVMDRAQS
jgi:copper homeostasis protein